MTSRKKKSIRKKSSPVETRNELSDGTISDSWSEVDGIEVALCFVLVFVLYTLRYQTGPNVIWKHVLSEASPSIKLTIW